MRIKKAARTCHTCEGCDALNSYPVWKAGPDGKPVLVRTGRACAAWADSHTGMPYELAEFPARPDWCNVPRSQAERDWKLEAQRVADTRKSVKALAKLGIKTRAQARQEGNAA